MIPLSKILFFVLLIILLVLVALLITSLAGGFSRRDESDMRKKQFYNYPVENYNYSGGRQKSLKYNRNQKYGGNRDEYKIYPISKFSADRHCNIIRGCADVLKDIEFRKLGAMYSVNANAAGSYSAYKLIYEIIRYTERIQAESHTLQTAINALGGGHGLLTGHIDALENKMNALANTADDLLNAAIIPIRHDVAGLNTEDATIIKNEADLIAALTTLLVTTFNDGINNYIEKLTDAMISIEHALNDTFIIKIVYRNGIPNEIITLHQNIYTFYNAVNTETNELLVHIKNAKICNNNKVINELIAYSNGGGANPIECAYAGFQAAPVDARDEYAALTVAATACHATTIGGADKISVTTAAIGAIPLSRLSPHVHANAQLYTAAIAAGASPDDIKHAVYNANPTSALFAEANTAAAADNNTLLARIATEIERYNAISPITGAGAIATLNAGLREIIAPAAGGGAAADAASVATAINTSVVAGNPGSVDVNTAAATAAGIGGATIEGVMHAAAMAAFTYCYTTTNNDAAVAAAAAGLAVGTGPDHLSEIAAYAFVTAYPLPVGVVTTVNLLAAVENAVIGARDAGNEISDAETNAVAVVASNIPGASAEDLIGAIATAVAAPAPVSANVKDIITAINGAALAAITTRINANFGQYWIADASCTGAAGQALWEATRNAGSNRYYRPVAGAPDVASVISETQLHCNEYSKATHIAAINGISSFNRLCTATIDSHKYPNKYNILNNNFIESLSSILTNIEFRGIAAAAFSVSPAQPNADAIMTAINTYARDIHAANVIMIAAAAAAAAAAAVAANPAVVELDHRGRQLTINFQNVVATIVGVIGANEDALTNNIGQATTVFNTGISNYKNQYSAFIDALESALYNQDLVGYTKDAINAAESIASTILHDAIYTYYDTVNEQNAILLNALKINKMGLPAALAAAINIAGILNAIEPLTNLYINTENLYNINSMELLSNKNHNVNKHHMLNNTLLDSLVNITIDPYFRELTINANNPATLRNTLGKVGHLDALATVTAIETYITEIQAANVAIIAAIGVANAIPVLGAIQSIANVTIAVTNIIANYGALNVAAIEILADADAVKTAINGTKVAFRGDINAYKTESALFIDALEIILCDDALIQILNNQAAPNHADTVTLFTAIYVYYDSINLRLANLMTALELAKNGNTARGVETAAVGKSAADGTIAATAASSIIAGNSFFHILYMDTKNAYDYISKNRKISSFNYNIKNNTFIDNIANILADIDFRDLQAAYNAAAHGHDHADTIITAIETYVTGTHAANIALFGIIAGVRGNVVANNSYINLIFIEHHITNGADFDTAINHMKSATISIVADRPTLIASIALNIAAFYNNIKEYKNKITPFLDAIDTAMCDHAFTSNIDASVIAVRDGITAYYASINTELNTLLTAINTIEKLNTDEAKIIKTNVLVSNLKMSIIGEINKAIPIKIGGAGDSTDYNHYFGIQYNKDMIIISNEIESIMRYNIVANQAEFNHTGDSTNAQFVQINAAAAAADNLLAIDNNNIFLNYSHKFNSTADLIYLGKTTSNDYIFTVNPPPPTYTELSENSLFYLCVLNRHIVGNKIIFVDTAAKIGANIATYAPTHIISMAISTVSGNRETTPYKVFTHLDANIYEIDNSLYPYFSTVINTISPIINAGNPIDDTTTIKPIADYVAFLNSLKKGDNHNYYYSVNDLATDQFTQSFQIADITATGVLQDIAGNINIFGKNKNIYQILFYQPLLDFNDDAAAIYARSEAEFAANNLNHNYRIHIGDLAVEPSYFGFYDVQNGRAQTHHHKIKMMDTLHTKSIGGSRIDTNQHNIIYTFEPFHEYVAGADATVAGFNAQMELFSGYILKKALNEEKVPLLFYDIAPASLSIHKFITSSDAVDNVTTPIELYALCCSEYIDIAITNRAANINEQKIFILETPGALLTSVGGPAPTHVKKYEHGTNNAFDDNRSYYLYSNNNIGAGIIKHTMTTNTLAKLQIHSVEQLDAAASNTDKLNKFLENIDCTVGKLITVSAIGGTAPFLNTIRFRYNISGASTIKAGVDDPDKTVAKSVDINVGGNHYDTMIDNCYHVIDLVNVADINSIITSNNKRAFCQLDHPTGIIRRSVNLNTYSNFLNENLSSIPFIHRDTNNPPALDNSVNSINGNIVLKYKTNIAGVYAEINLIDYLGCGCIGFYDKGGGANWHHTGGIVHYREAIAVASPNYEAATLANNYEVSIFDDNENTKNYINAVNTINAANFQMNLVSIINIILYTDKPEQIVIFFSNSIIIGDYPTVLHNNCNVIIPLQSDKNNTPFEDTEFHYYFGRYANNKYYLSKNLTRQMFSQRNVTGANDGLNWVNLKNLRINHLMIYQKNNSPLIFKKYNNIITIDDVRQIIKPHMVCEYIGAHDALFVSNSVHSSINTIARCDRIPIPDNANANRRNIVNMRIPVPRIEPYDKAVKYASVPYNATIAKPLAITHELRIDNYMGGNLSFFGVYETALANMTVDATSINSRIFRYSDNIEYNRIIKAAFMMHRPYQIYVPPAAVPPGNPILLSALHLDPLKYVWISGELSINLDGLSPFSAFNALNTLSTVSSPALPLTDVILYTTATEVLESDEARLRVAPSVKEPEPVKEIEPEPVYTVDMHVRNKNILKDWISQLNMDSGKSHLVDTDGKTIPNDSNSRHNHPGATEVATIQIKEVEIVKSEKDYIKILNNYNKEVNIARKRGKPIPIAKIYMVPLSKDWLNNKKNKKTYSLVDKHGNLDLTNIQNGTYYYKGQEIYL